MKSVTRGNNNGHKEQVKDHLADIKVKKVSVKGIGKEQ